MPRSSILGSALLALTLVLLPHGDVWAQERQAFTADDVLNLRTLSVEDLSPDGRWIAATIRTARDRLGVDHQRYGDPTYASSSPEELVLLDTETGEQRPILEGKVETSAITWSPDGRRLAFLLRNGDTYGLRVYERDQGTVTAIDLGTTKEVASSSGITWRPDGSGVLLSLREEGWRELARAEFLTMTEGPIVVQDSGDPFLDWDRVRGLGGLTIPALVDLSSGEVRELFPEGRYSGLEQTDDGRYLTALTQKPLKTVYEGNDGTEWGLLRLDLQSGEVTTLVEPSTDRIRANWSPDGSRYAFAERGEIWLRSIEADSARRLTPEVEEEAEGAEAGAEAETEEEDSTRVRYSVMRWSPDGASLLLGSQRGWYTLGAEGGEPELVFELEEDEDLRPDRSVVEWSPDGGHLYISTSHNDRWERGLARLDLETERIEQLVSDANLYRGWDLSEDGTRLIFRMSDGDHPDELYVADPDLRGTRRLTDENPWLDSRKLTRSELIEYLDVDGKEQFGILYYPVDYEPGRRYPLVAEIYEDFFANGFNQNMNLLANEGWFGFRPSVEFEEGFPGEAWLKGVTAGINVLIDRGLVDGERLGVHGTSYGGYATNLLITQTDRFAAAINISGKVNIISFLGDSPKITTRNYRAAESGQDRIGATLWEQPQKYIAHSAVMFADRIETPLLLLSGEGDWNVPATNQREMYYALRRLGKKVVWVNYMLAGHGAGRAGTVSDFFDHWDRILGWYREHFEAVGTTAKEITDAGGG